MEDERKKQLFPFFAYMYSKIMNPKKYKDIPNIEEWTKVIQENPEDIDAIAQKASSLSDEDWGQVEQQAGQIASDEPSDTPTYDTDAQYAKKGAKLLNLKKFKTKKKIVAKKCECGCDTIEKKGEGGEITSVCSCGCGGKMQKHKADNSKLDYLKKIKK